MNDAQIILYEQFIDPEHELYLSPNEFMIYSHLYLFRRYYKQIATITIDMMHQVLPKFKSRRETDNKMYIKSVLLTLRDKGLINFDEDDPKYSTVINITFNKMDNTRYDYIPADIHEKTNDPKEFLILCVVEARCSRDKKRGCIMSFSEWAKILGCTSQTAINVINRMLSKGLIWKKTGKFNGNKQEINAYFNYDIGTKKENGQRSTGKPNENQVANHYVENPDSPLVEMGKNWFVDRSNLEDADFEAYVHIENKKEEDRTPGEKALYEAANNRAKRLRSTHKGREFFDNKLKKAKRKINNKNNKKVREDNTEMMLKISMGGIFDADIDELKEMV